MSSHVKSVTCVGWDVHAVWTSRELMGEEGPPNVGRSSPRESSPTVYDAPVSRVSYTAYMTHLFLGCHIRSVDGVRFTCVRPERGRRSVRTPGSVRLALTARRTEPCGWFNHPWLNQPRMRLKAHLRSQERETPPTNPRGCPTCHISAGQSPICCSEKLWLCTDSFRWERLPSSRVRRTRAPCRSDSAPEPKPATSRSRPRPARTASRAHGDHQRVDRQR